MATERPSATDIVRHLDFNAITAKRVAWGDWDFTIVGPSTVEVTNASYGFLKDEHTYRVVLDEEGLPDSCECPGYEHHFGPKGMADKHMVAPAVVGGPIVIEAARSYPADEPSTLTSPGRESEGLVTDGGAVTGPGVASGSLTEDDEDECEACEELPDDFPCANCYISGAKDFPSTGMGR